MNQKLTEEQALFEGRMHLIRARELTLVALAEEAFKKMMRDVLKE